MIYGSSAHLISSHLISHHITSHHITHLTSPHLTSPHLTSPHLTSHHITSHHTTPRHSRRGWRNSIITLITPSTPVPSLTFIFLRMFHSCDLSLSCHHNLVSGSLFFHFLFFCTPYSPSLSCLYLSVCNSSLTFIFLRMFQSWLDLVLL